MPRNWQPAVFAYTMPGVKAKSDKIVTALMLVFKSTIQRTMQTGSDDYHRAAHRRHRRRSYRYACSAAAGLLIPTMIQPPPAALIWSRDPIAVRIGAQTALFGGLALDGRRLITRPASLLQDVPPPGAPAVIIDRKFL